MRPELAADSATTLFLSMLRALDWRGAMSDAVVKGRWLTTGCLHDADVVLGGGH